MKNRFLLVVQLAPFDLLSAVRKLRRLPEFSDVGLLIATSHPELYGLQWAASDVPVCVVSCDFRSDESLRKALAPFLDKLAGVICRGDKQVQYLRRVVPFLPAHVLVATAESLAAATNKRVMRTAFRQQCPEITPQFVEISDDSLRAVAAVEAALTYPIIVKPAHLASSLLIQSCHNRSELQMALQQTFARIRPMYQQTGRHDRPEVIAEEYMKGTLYSVDAYVMQPSAIFFCPPISYVSARQLGVDDFFLYKRFAPAALNVAETNAANQVAAKAIRAVGLQHSSVHVELAHTAKGWKIVELGPRLGRFRNLMYQQAYDIDHAYNDALIHLGKKPVIPTQLLRFCAAYSLYPEYPGILREIKHLRGLEQNPLVKHLQVFAKPGDDCQYAKDGGHALAEFVIASADKHEFETCMRFIETEVKAVID